MVLLTGEPRLHNPVYTLDEGGHLIVSVNYNTDIGDAWEYADAPEYPEHMTTLAYRYGLNYLVYSLTH